MRATIPVSVRGRVRTTLRDIRTGAEFVHEQRNLLLDSFLDRWFTQNVAFFHTNTMSQCLLGDGNTPPSPSDTGLSGNTLATHSSPVTVVPAPTAGDLIQTVPDVLPAGNGRGVSWSPDGQYLAVAHVGSPYVTVYKRDGEIGRATGRDGV